MPTNVGATSYDPDHVPFQKMLSGHIQTEKKKLNQNSRQYGMVKAARSINNNVKGYNLHTILFFQPIPSIVSHTELDAQLTCATSCHRQQPDATLCRQARRISMILRRGMKGYVRQCDRGLLLTT